MKAIVIFIAAVSAIPILALPPVPAALPPVVHAGMVVMTNIDFLAEVAP